MLVPAADRTVTARNNNPPGPIDHAKEAMGELSAWLKEFPVIQTPQDAKQGAAYVERTRISLQSMEDERSAKVSPLNTQLAKINGTYRAVREPLERVLKELKRRLTVYATAEEAKRQAEAAAKRAEAEEAERIARQAEADEQDAIAQADVGVLDVDVGEAINNADAAFADYARADRQAAVAERNSKVRIGSAMGGRALSMRQKRVLAVANLDDAVKALRAIGLTEDIKVALVRAAKHFEEAHGELPAGVTETFERSL